jgi:hypothetical protein
MNEQLYVDKIVETVRFFFEMHEERGQGDTRVMNLLKPANVPNGLLRKKVLGESFNERCLDLTDAALELDRWLRERGLIAPGLGDVSESLRDACPEHQRLPRTITDEQEIRSRAFIRLARYYQLMHKHGTAVSMHSRVPDYFIQQRWVRPRPMLGHHPEHVVPCAYIRAICIDRYQQQWSVERVAQLAERLLWIVDIPHEHRRTLDEGLTALKDRMPEGWDPETGCIFKRLHEKKIPFEHARESLRCACPLV